MLFMLGMNTDIESFARTCDACQVNQSSPSIKYHYQAGGERRFFF